MKFTCGQEMFVSMKLATIGCCIISRHTAPSIGSLHGVPFIREVVNVHTFTQISRILASISRFSVLYSFRGLLTACSTVYSAHYIIIHVCLPCFAVLPLAHSYQLWTQWLLWRYSMHWMWTQPSTCWCLEKAF